MPTAVLEDGTAFYWLVPKDGGGDVTLPGDLKEHSEKWLNGLNPVEKMAAIRLLQKYPDFFSKGEMDIGMTNVVKHSIPLQDGAMPVKQKPYRHPPVLEKEIERQVEQLQERGLIKPGSGAWSSSVVMVKKKDSAWRFCVDYRSLNAVTKVKD